MYSENIAVGILKDKKSNFIENHQQYKLSKPTVSAKSSATMPSYSYVGYQIEPSRPIFAFSKYTTLGTLSYNNNAWKNNAFLRPIHNPLYTGNIKGLYNKLASSRKVIDIKSRRLDKYVKLYMKSFKHMRIVTFVSTNISWFNIVSDANNIIWESDTYHVYTLTYIVMENTNIEYLMIDTINILTIHIYKYYIKKGETWEEDDFINHYMMRLQYFKKNRIIIATKSQTYIYDTSDNMYRLCYANIIMDKTGHIVEEIYYQYTRLWKLNPDYPKIFKKIIRYTRDLMDYCIEVHLIGKHGDEIYVFNVAGKTWTAKIILHSTSRMNGDCNLSVQALTVSSSGTSKNDQSSILDRSSIYKDVNFNQDESNEPELPFKEYNNNGSKLSLKSKDDISVTLESSKDNNEFLSHFVNIIDDLIHISINLTNVNITVVSITQNILKHFTNTRCYNLEAEELYDIMTKQNNIAMFEEIIKTLNLVGTQLGCFLDYIERRNTVDPTLHKVDGSSKNNRIV
ncbi:hypothetical protein BdWA1_002549 [Babesia duncani]|uniref:Uncharacterized protein n=1 Tax=Babesia duncani TaxID=323732 RepID=A0AAD9PJX9_9APIC|nr:hypothetical protein BdWA1_002549 [Babesia duncani]